MLHISSPRSFVVGVVGLFVATLLVVQVLSDVGYDPTIFTAFGEDAAPTREYAEERLGQVFLRAQQGHDGKFFFVQANDPWVLEPDVHAAVLDRPLYRSQRMLYPMIAGGVGLFGPEVIAWSMIAVNVLALAIGSWAVAMLAEDMGLTTWLGLAFVLNIGFISEMNIGGAGVLAAALAFLGVVAVRRERWILATVLFVLAALSREAMILAPMGVAFWLWRSDNTPRAVQTIGVPLLAIAAWAAYLRVRIDLAVGVSEVQEIGLPFGGFVGAFGSWTKDPIDLVVGIAMMLLLLLYTRRVIASKEPVGWAFLGFVPLAILFTEQVWKSYFDITRAIAPVLTAFVLLVFLASARRQPGDTEQVFAS